MAGVTKYFAGFLFSRRAEITRFYRTFATMKTTIALFGKRRQSNDDFGRLVRLFERLAGNDVDCLVERRFYDAVSRALRIEIPVDGIIDGPDFDADAVMSIGGDGTLLRTARSVGDKEIPIVGFNTGHLGFLAEESLDDAPAIVDRLIARDYEVDDRTQLWVTSESGLELTDWPFALNEVAVLRQDSANMISVNTLLDNMPVASYQGDGLIISTPTGSTAYNLSVGGPVVEPTAPAWVLSPIAPHSLTMRPLVVSDNRVISISVETRSDTYRVSLDGRTVTLPSNERIVIARAPFVTRIIHTHGHDFFDTLRNKLLWGMTRRG